MIPLKTDRPLRTTPWVNYTLIGLNVLVFLLFLALPPDTATRLHILFDLHPRTIIYTAHGEPVARALPHVWQYLTSMFLHGGWMHIGGNMLFLWVFGNLVEDKLGHVGYLFFYLAAGVFSGIGHCLTATAPAIGASGAISGVTGAFLVLFPQTRVRVLWLLFIITIIDIPSLWFIGFSIARDVFMAVAPGETGVAYTAHIAGNLFGIVAGFAVLWTRLLPREPYDLMTMLSQWNRRRQFRAVTRRGYDPWKGIRTAEKKTFRDQNDQTARRGGEPTDQESEAEPPELSEAETREVELRQRISSAISRGDNSAAAELYCDLLAKSPNAVLSESSQLDVANSLFAKEDYATAEIAYRRLLDSYPASDPRGEIRLMLGLTLAKYLNRSDEARPFLEQALERLPEGDNRRLAAELTQHDEPDPEGRDSADSPDQGR